MPESGNVVHTVLIKLKDGVTDEQVEHLRSEIATLTSVPGVRTISSGRTFTTARAGGYSFGISVELENKEALSVYASHPDHVRVKDEALLPLTDDLVALDWVH